MDILPLYREVVHMFW